VILPDLTFDFSDGLGLVFLQYDGSEFVGLRAKIGAELADWLPRSSENFVERKIAG
jgi:hypothetical protein